MIGIPDNIVAILGTDNAGNVVSIESSIFRAFETTSVQSVAPTPIAQTVEPAKTLPVPVTIPDTEPFIFTADPNYIPQVNSVKDNLINSILYQRGIKMGVNTINPQFTFDVYGGSINVTPLDLKDGYRINRYLMAWQDITKYTLYLGDNTFLKIVDVNSLLISGLALVTSPTTPRVLSIDDTGLVSTLSLTSGSVIFSNGIGLVQDNNTFFWDNTNKRLGIGNKVPTEALHVTGSIRQSAVITAMLKADSTGKVVAAVAGTDYLIPSSLTGYLLASTAAATYQPIGSYLTSYTEIYQGTVTAVSVVSANGFAGTVATASATPAITISTTVTGLLKGNGTAISAATAGTDYLIPSSLTGYLLASTAASTYQPIGSYLTSYTEIYQGTVTTVSVVSANGFAGTVATATTTPAITISTSVTGLLKGNGTAISAAVAGTDYLATISGIAAGGELSGTYPNPTLVNSAVTGKVLTGVTTVSGQVNADDTILSAFGKVQSQLNALSGSLIYKGSWNASTNTPTLTSGVGTTGNYYIVSVAGTTTIDGVSSWSVGDWIVFNGTTSKWEKIATQSVTSVNGHTGVVTLITDDIQESVTPTNKYFTNARAIGSTLTGYVSGTGTISSADTVLGAIQKLNGNIGALVTGVSSVSGTTNRITATPTTGNVVVDIASTYVGQSSITTVGTITTGTWQGTAIANTYVTGSTNWNTAFGWGNHASAGYALATSLSGYQPLDADLTAIAALTGSGLLRNTAGTWSLDPAAYTTNLGTVTTVSVVSANGFAGTVATATTTPAITISTTITGLLKGNGTTISAATAGTDYLVPSSLSGYLLSSTAASTYQPIGSYLTSYTEIYQGTVTTVSVVSANGFAGTVATATTTPAITISTSVTGLLKGNGTAISAATAGTDYLIPSNLSGYLLSSTAASTYQPIGSYLTSYTEIYQGTVTNVSALTIGTTGTDIASSVATPTTTPVITLNIPTASAANRGALSAADWTTFNSKQAALGYVPASSQTAIVINGLSQTLAANRTWSVGTVTDVAALTIGSTGTNITSTVATGTTTPVITLNIPTASASARGALSSTDWTTFNNKQAYLGGTGLVRSTAGAISYDTATYYLASNPNGYISGNQSITLSGDVSGTGTTAITTTLATITQAATGSFVKVTLDTKGRVTGNTAVIASDITTALTYTPVPEGRTLTINGVAQTLAANRSWTIDIGTNVRNVIRFTATAGQTTFTITGGYTVGLVDVYLNGARLIGSDYTASNGTTVVLAAGVIAGDVIETVSYTSYAASSISGAGTTGYLTKWTGSSSQGNSIIQDSGSAITVGGSVTATSFSGAGTGLTGTASSLSIGGNAVTASSTTYLAALGNYVWTSSSLPTAYNMGVQTSFVQASNGWQSYGTVITAKSYVGGGGTLQLFTPYSPTYGGVALQVRFGNYDGGDVWTSWKTLLQSDNYNSYAPTLTGTGASGTWGISISGNAATATTATTASSANSVAWTNVSGRPTALSSFTNDSGYITGITSGNVTTALGYTPYNATNPAGYITGITSGNVTTALGYTPYNATNPSGYITSSASITGTSSNITAYTINQNVGTANSPTFAGQTINAGGQLIRSSSSNVGGSRTVNHCKVATTGTPIYAIQVTGLTNKLINWVCYFGSNDSYLGYSAYQIIANGIVWFNASGVASDQGSNWTYQAGSGNNGGLQFSFNPSGYANSLVFGSNNTTGAGGLTTNYHIVFYGDGVNSMTINYL